MSKYTRRSFIKTAALSATALSMPSIAFGALPKVVVIGGGAGGATAAKYIAKDSKGKVDVTLIEASKDIILVFFLICILVISEIMDLSVITITDLL